MNTDAEFDLKTFQSEVFKEFNKLKVTIGLARFHSGGFASSENFEEFSSDSASSNLFIKGILKFFSFWENEPIYTLTSPILLRKKEKRKKLPLIPKLEIPLVEQSKLKIGMIYF